MTKTVGNIAELLEAVLAHESSALDTQKIRHAPTIGNMYEALTAQELERHLPTGAGLSVVTGFARGYNGKLSSQLDCMIVMGDGETLPRIEAKVYPVHQVIAVIEVKKNIDTSRIGEAHDNLKSVLTLICEDGVPYGSRAPLVDSIFYRITGKRFADLPPNWLDGHDALSRIYGFLMFEAKQPLRIMLGYHGLKSENALRASLANHVEAIAGRRGYAPPTFPNVIVSPGAVAIKGIGMPWVGEYTKNRWDVLMTSGENSPICSMVEAIWWRLRYLNLIDDTAFAGEKATARWKRLISFRFVPEVNGWQPLLWRDQAAQKKKPSSSQRRRAGAKTRAHLRAR